MASSRLLDEQSWLRSQTEQISQQLLHGQSAVTRNAELLNKSFTSLDSDPSVIHGHWGCITSKKHLGNLTAQFPRGLEYSTFICSQSMYAYSCIFPYHCAYYASRPENVLLPHWFDVVGKSFVGNTGSLGWRKLELMIKGLREKEENSSGPIPYSLNESFRKGSKGYNGVAAAAVCNHWKSVTILIGNETNPESAGDDGDTPLVERRIAIRIAQARGVKPDGFVKAFHVMLDDILASKPKNLKQRGGVGNEHKMVQ